MEKWWTMLIVCVLCIQSFVGTVGADAKFPQEWEQRRQFGLIRQGKGSSWPTADPVANVILIILFVALLPIAIPIYLIF